ncbi:MAG: hypothetical protein A4E57_01881 [Syntrophorhabdaceae bacterium PtaU1.Bin034]|nr:MAG: hypothetical protein A4E57_01881 [Syntrophorhabdaceae bacterium PtaU1.Bin034]
MKSERPGSIEYSLDIFRPEDGPGVARLFRTVYGEGYPVKLVYDPDELTAAFNSRENIPVVVRTPDGEIIAYQALYRSAPNPDLYEAGQGLVLPAYRGIGVSRKVNHYMCDEMIPALGMEAVFGEAVCNHTAMQKSWSDVGPVETALEVDLMPREAYTAEKSASGRVATLSMFRLYRERAQVVYLPARYEESLKYLYSTPGIGRQDDFLPGKEGLPDKPSGLEIQVFDFAGVARIIVNEAGADFDDLFAQKEAELAKRGMTVFQVWLKLAWPFIGNVVEILRNRGYFLGGLLPRWFGTDGILMQKVVGQPNWDGIRLYSERAEKIMEIVQKDWAEASRAVAV